MPADIEAEIDKMIDQSINAMNRRQLNKFTNEALRILAEAEIRNKREMSPELHPQDCRCLRCISLRVD